MAVLMFERIAGNYAFIFEKYSNYALIKRHMKYKIKDENVYVSKILFKSRKTHCIKILVET